MANANRELSLLITGKTNPMEIAEIVKNWQLKKMRKRTVAAERRHYIESIISDGKKITMQQMDAIVWEYAMSNTMMPFSGWLGSAHPELFKVGKAADEIDVDADLDIDSPFAGVGTGAGVDTAAEFDGKGNGD